MYKVNDGLNDPVKLALGTTPSNFISPRHYYFRFLKNFAPSESIQREAFKGADCGGAHVFQSEKVSHMGRGVQEPPQTLRYDDRNSLWANQFQDHGNSDALRETPKTSKSPTM